MYYFSQQLKKQSKLPKINQGLRASQSSTNLVRKKRVYDSLPALNEPVVLRYDKKALYDSEVDNLTYRKYRVYKPKNTQNDWSTSQIFVKKMPRDYLRESIKRGRKEKFFTNR